MAVLVRGVLLLAIVVMAEVVAGVVFLRGVGVLFRIRTLLWGCAGVCARLGAGLVDFGSNFFSDFGFGLGQIWIRLGCNFAFFYFFNFSLFFIPFFIPINLELREILLNGFERANAVKVLRDKALRRFNGIYVDAKKT